MNKDAILASIIGFGIGLLITGAILVGPSLLPLLKKINKKGDVQSATTQVSPTLTAGTGTTFTIDTPTDETIAQDATITVSGHAPKGTTIIIDNTEGEVATQSTDTNTFQGQIPLKEGKNDISVTQVADPTSTTKHVTIYYTPKS